MWSMLLDDYKEYFKEDTEIKDEDEIIFLVVEGFEDENDKPYTYSIKWYNQLNDEKINSIIFTKFFFGSKIKSSYLINKYLLCF